MRAVVAVTREFFATTGSTSKLPGKELRVGGGAGIGGSARRETVYAMPVDAPKHVLLDVDGYVAGGELPRGTSSGGGNGAIIYAVAADERGWGRQAVSNLTYGAPGQNDSSV